MPTITHGDRVVYPKDGWTKADVVAHYGRVADAMLPHLVARPLTLVRYRTNIEDKGFFQKNSPSHFPAIIPRIEVPKHDGVNQHASVDSREGLEYLANQGAVELHVALATAPALDRPDRLVIDLDPLSDDPTQVRGAASTPCRSLPAARAITSTSRSCRPPRWRTSRARR